jgi:hypothetical protein
MSAAPPPIVPRKPDFPFEDAEIPRHWYSGNAVATHLANALNLVFPAGERFFIRSVKHYLPRIRDPKLAADARAFFAQEAMHGREHERFFAVLRAQGYQIDGFLRGYERVAYGLLERVCPRALNLSCTVALEHLTATLAEAALGSDLLDQAHPTMAELLRWHAAEEIEHKAVAFDVLREVAPGRALRVAGLVCAVAGLVVAATIATVLLVRQDRSVTRAQVRRDWATIRGRDDQIGIGFLARAIREYVRRDFHPWHNDNRALAEGFLAGRALALGPGA